jgi:hypothetical protein
MSTWPPSHLIALAHPLSPPALAKILWHSGMKSNNTCNSLTHSCCHQFLLEGNSRYTGARVRAQKNICYHNHKTCNWFKETWCRIDWVCVDGFWMKQRLCTIVSPYTYSLPKIVDLITAVCVFSNNETIYSNTQCISTTKTKRVKWRMNWMIGCRLFGLSTKP